MEQDPLVRLADPENVTRLFRLDPFDVAEDDDRPLRRRQLLERDLQCLQGFRAKGPRLRGTLAGYFIGGTLVSLSALAVIGRFGREELRLSLFLIPGTVLGYFMSRPAAAYLDAGYTRIAVLVVSALAALSVIATVLF